MASPDGCFKGLRGFGEDLNASGVRTVDADTISNPYAHARMPTAALHHSGQDTEYAPCPEGAPHWPRSSSGLKGAWRLHWENDYTPRLANIQVKGQDKRDVEPFLSAHKFVLLAYKAYDTTKRTKEAIDDKLPHWRLVARETRISGSGDMYDEDPVTLVQNSKTFDCALVFAGTNNGLIELTTPESTRSVKYCGFDHVHAGYRNELRQITHDLWEKLRPKLAQCRTVTCAGHSLGGSLCEIFAACANSKRLTDPDYQAQMWARVEPQAMEEIVRGGTYSVPGAEKRCQEPPCPKIP